jgi:hypothetical protein
VTRLPIVALVLASAAAHADLAVAPASPARPAEPTRAQLRAAIERFCQGPQRLPDYYSEAPPVTKRRACADMRHELDAPDTLFFDHDIPDDAPEEGPAGVTWHVTDRADEATTWGVHLRRHGERWRVHSVGIEEDCTGP